MRTFYAPLCSKHGKLSKSKSKLFRLPRLQGTTVLGLVHPTISGIFVGMQGSSTLLMSIIPPYIDCYGTAMGLWDSCAYSISTYHLCRKVVHPGATKDGSDARPGRVGSDENPAGERSSALTRSSLGRSPGD